jgi:hypothetical protein
MEMKTTTLNLITKTLTTLAELSPRLLPLFLVVGVIVGFGVLGLIVWKGKL